MRTSPDLPLTVVELEYRMRLTPEEFYILTEECRTRLEPYSPKLHVTADGFVLTMHCAAGITAARDHAPRMALPVLHVEPVTVQCTATTPSPNG